MYITARMITIDHVVRGWKIVTRILIDLQMEIIISVATRRIGPNKVIRLLHLSSMLERILFVSDAVAGADTAHLLWFFVYFNKKLLKIVLY